MEDGKTLSVPEIKFIYNVKFSSASFTDGYKFILTCTHPHFHLFTPFLFHLIIKLIFGSQLNYGMYGNCYISKISKKFKR